MDQLKHYSNMHDELEARIDAIVTVFTWNPGRDWSELEQALRDLGADPKEIELASEKAGF